MGYAGTSESAAVILNNIAAEFINTRTPAQAKAIETKTDTWYEKAEEAFVKCRLRIKPMAVRLREERKKAYNKRMEIRDDYLEASPCSTRPKVAAEYRELSKYGKRGAEQAKKSRKKTTK
jgi:hypothetical protein